MSTQIERAVALLMRHDDALGCYVQETYNALQDVVNHFMPGEGSGVDSRTVDDCLVRGAAVLCDIPLLPTAGYIEKPCVECGVSTARACGDCARANKDTPAVHVCWNAFCRTQHLVEKHA